MVKLKDQKLQVKKTKDNHWETILNGCAFKHAHLKEYGNSKIQTYKEYIEQEEKNQYDDTWNELQPFVLRQRKQMLKYIIDEVNDTNFNVVLQNYKSEGLKFHVKMLKALNLKKEMIN